MMLNNRLLRIVQMKKRSAHTLDLYRSYKTLPINKLFMFRLLLYAHALYYKSSLLPKFFHNKVQLNLNIHDHFTRTQSDFHLAQTNTSASTKLSYNKATLLFNSLPSEIKNIQAVNLFKISIKEFLLAS